MFKDVRQWIWQKSIKAFRSLKILNFSICTPGVSVFIFTFVRLYNFFCVELFFWYHIVTYGNKLDSNLFKLLSFVVICRVFEKYYHSIIDLTTVVTCSSLGTWCRYLKLKKLMGISKTYVLCHYYCKTLVWIDCLVGTYHVFAREYFVSGISQFFYF